MALRGNLVDFGLAEVFQLIGQQRKSGRLEIKTRDAGAVLAFSSGAVVWAEPRGSGEHSALGEMLIRCGLITREALTRALESSRDSARSLRGLLAASGEVSEADLEAALELLTRDTIFRVLRWTEGSFHFSAQTVRHDGPPERLLGAEQLLMDGLRMVDEWQTFAAWVPSAQSVFRRSGDFSVYRQRASGSARDRLPHAERVRALVDGRLDARRIIDLSRLGTFEATRVLAELRRAGMIELLEGRRSRSRPRSQKRRFPVVQQLRGWAAAALPLLLLAGAAALAQQPPAWLRAIATPSAAPAAARAIERRAFERARQAFETRRLRSALQAHRYRDGAWPERLVDLGDIGWESGASLTPTGAPEYYYARGGEGVTVLAPRR